MEQQKKKKKPILHILVAILITIRGAKSFLFTSKSGEKFYLVHRVPKQKKSKLNSSPIRVTYFRILNGGSGIEIGDQVKIRIRGYPTKDTFLARPIELLSTPHQASEMLNLVRTL